MGHQVEAGSAPRRNHATNHTGTIDDPWSKDLDTAGLERYAGTSQRYSQRLLVFEAANRKWPIASTDISKAFLQGVTYKELSEMTGEPLRDVCFVLPPSSIAALKQLPGFENFALSEARHGISRCPTSLSPKTG